MAAPKGSPLLSSVEALFENTESIIIAAFQVRSPPILTSMAQIKQQPSFLNYYFFSHVQLHSPQVLLHSYNLHMTDRRRRFLAMLTLLAPSCSRHWEQRWGQLVGSAAAHRWGRTPRSGP